MAAKSIGWQDNRYKFFCKIFAKFIYYIDNLDKMKCWKYISINIKYIFDNIPEYSIEYIWKIINASSMMRDLAWLSAVSLTLTAIPESISLCSGLTWGGLRRDEPT